MFTSIFPRIFGVPAGVATRRWLGPLALALLVNGAQAQQAQPGQSMEERLRAQLRITTAQLQQAQNELAALKSAPGVSRTTAPPSDVEALKKDLARAQAQLAAERQASGGPSARQQIQAALDKATAQVVQQRASYDAALKLARAAEAERVRLTLESESRHASLTQCEAKNAQLYAVSQEILHAFEAIDIGSLFAARQPFAAQSRVKLEQTAQQYGDQLYAGRFDARSATAPVQGAEAKAADGGAAAAVP